MSDPDSFRSRVTTSLALSASPIVPDKGIQQPSQVARGPIVPFAERDLSEWGVTAAPQSEGIRLQLTMSERHVQVLEAFARKRRTANRATIERIIEKFVESGEFARLMDQYD